MTVQSPTPQVAATPIPQVDKMLERLEAHRLAWVRLTTDERAALMRRCMQTTAEQAERWANTACQIKGYVPGSNGHGEEYLGGVLAVMRNLRLFAEALEANGQPTLPKTWQRPDGQWVARVFPQSLVDRALFTGVTCDIWIEPGNLPTQGRIYRDSTAVPEGGVSVVLGAGNQSSIPPMDVLYKLVVDNEVCILKMNPVNEALGPVLRDALKPLVDAGFLEVCYGGIEVGQHLTDHPTVTSIHITGSARAHDAILWGPGKEGEKRKKAGTPRIDKHITSELGCVSPVLVVPGDWSDKELDHHARQVAAMLAYNCGFNCNGARLVLLAKGWKHTARFRELVRQKLAATPTRYAYYPSAQATWNEFTAKYPESTKLGTPGEGHLPWTILQGVGTVEGEFALENEPWCGIFTFVELEATTAAEYLDVAVPFANDRCWGTLSVNVLVHPKTEKELGEERMDRAIADLRYGSIAINCWSGLNYGLVNATWGAFPGHPLDDIQSGQGVVHNGLLLDHPQKNVVRTPFIISPTPAWFTDHKNNLALGQKLVGFELAPSWLKVPGVALAALKG
ncbi:MAG: aldehyde dehydrogenase family protein [Myxococcota bacterium]